MTRKVSSKRFVRLGKVREAVINGLTHSWEQGTGDRELSGSLIK